MQSKCNMYFIQVVVNKRGIVRVRNSVAVQFGKSSWQKYGLRRRNSPRASRIRKEGWKALTLPTSHNQEEDTIRYRDELCITVRTVTAYS